VLAFDACKVTDRAGAGPRFGDPPDASVLILNPKLTIFVAANGIALT
jgi:hypothetical protein